MVFHGSVCLTIYCLVAAFSILRLGFQSSGQIQTILRHQDSQTQYNGVATERTILVVLPVLLFANERVFSSSMKPAASSTSPLIAVPRQRPHHNSTSQHLVWSDCPHTDSCTKRCWPLKMEGRCFGAILIMSQNVERVVPGIPSFRRLQRWCVVMFGTIIGHIYD